MCSTLQKWLISNHINCECIPKEGKQQSVLCTNLGYKKKHLSTDYIKPPDSVHWLHWGWEESVMKMSISKARTMQASLMPDSPSSPSLLCQFGAGPCSWRWAEPAETCMDQKGPLPQLPRGPVHGRPLWMLRIWTEPHSPGTGLAPWSRLSSRRE